MDHDLHPDDFIRKCDVAKGTNIFVSYPHLEDSLLRSTPDEVVEGHRNIVYLAWEQRGGTHYWKDVYADYDQVWALSDFAAESLSNVLERKVHSVPCIVDTSAFPPPSTKAGHGLDPALFTFLFIFDANSSTERKNPEAVVDAFRSAFRADDRVHLVIKASSADRLGNRARLQRLRNAIGGDSRIEVRVEDLSRHDLYGLVSASDAYVSLHRGEGFGYTCAEAMVYARPVIATGYSGNMQFMNESNSYPVRYREIEATVQEGPFQRGSLWAEPDVEHAASLMRHVYEHRDEAAARGLLGRSTIESTSSPAAVAMRIRTLLEGDGAADSASPVVRFR
jgi:glycosyltransferase involved in cell wall biosynthesis